MKPTDTAPDPRQALLKLENDYADYRRSCNLGLCISEPIIHEDFRRRIRRADAQLKARRQ